MEKVINSQNVSAMLREIGFDANFAFGWAWGEMSDEQREHMAQGIARYVEEVKAR